MSSCTSDRQGGKNKSNKIETFAGHQNGFLEKETKTRVTILSLDCVRRQDSSTQCTFERAWKMTMGRKQRKFPSVEEKGTGGIILHENIQKSFGSGLCKKQSSFNTRTVHKQMGEITHNFNEKASWQIFFKTQVTERCT